jgi:hypothetical protein
MRNFENKIVPYYVHDGKLYPIMMSDAEFELVQIAVLTVLKDIQVVDLPQGEIEVLNPKEESK